MIDIIEIALAIAIVLFFLAFLLNGAEFRIEAGNDDNKNGLEERVKDLEKRVAILEKNETEMVS